MNYELAKKLKDAGFPQRGSSFIFLHKNGQEQIRMSLSDPIEFKKDGGVYGPTLSELIEACGLRFAELKKFSEKNYTAICYAIKVGDTTMMCEGSTPEEAVAQLWLALNKSHEY